jgi:hypothetical protein
MRHKRDIMGRAGQGTRRRDKRDMSTLTAILCAIVGGCSTAAVDPEPPRAAFGCVDDSKQCIEQRQAALRALQGDRTKAWVRQPASINSYATGVRLFAFRTEKSRLSCDELSIGRREADAAPGVLRGPQAQGLQPQIVSRSIMFAGEVSKELGREAQRRCRA